MDIQQSEQIVKEQLHEALSHLAVAINHSILLVQADEKSKKIVGHDWESFLGDFFSQVREKGKVSRINLMSLISFPRMR
ncbi:hypothetical protein EHS13_07440 [Paenibacillus psychroresistens]|uniref:PAS domain-containing protein n=1 Tax=Paenibacillus psychroresistens TaxID=1778678 RepID=A0A6B8RFL1_9BACL|nr:hypothetical protein [Paenibacillus psychroresistens]QGQ94727.1 hypothetical protein EHS13_07440 [Paenibacillus psychroresistens]